MIVAGDIGGTHARIGSFTDDAHRPQEIRSKEYPSRDYKGLVEIVRDFLQFEKDPVRVFCFGVAGPVMDGVARPTNLHWELDAVEMKESLNGPVLLINDLEANAFGVSTLADKDLATLQEGKAEIGNAAVISAGTGLGESGLFWNGDTHLPWACEGGHSTFAPRSPEEIELLEYLTRRFGHVSWERLLSGPGLLNIYQFLRDTGKGSEPEWLTEKLQEGDPSAVIAGTAASGTSNLCAKAMDLFVSLYGSEAGNLALKTMSVNGVYLGGGIAPKIIDRLRGGGFAQSFAAKGRMQALLETIPIRVITNDRTALQGAARCGALRAK